MSSLPLPDRTFAVRDFVAPLEPSGSLEASRSFQSEEDPLSLGARLHARIQKRLQLQDPSILCEVPVRMALEVPGFRCLVRGRLDVLFPDPLRVEEVKTGFSPAALLRDVEADDDHPFALQARMYAWMRWKATSEIPLCRLRVLGLLDESEAFLDLPFDPEAFSRWVEARLQEHRGAFERAAERREERRRVGEALAFPFPEPRPGQEELVAQVESALEGGCRLLLQAPTGLGKTAAILFPALAHALARDFRVFYGTPRNSQHEVAEDCVRRMRALGHPVRSVTLKAKERVCPQPAVDCRPEVCPRALLYYDRLKASGALEHLAQAGCADAALVREVADRHELCPFELSLDATRGADVVIGDYNYAFSPNATLIRCFGSPEAASRMLVLVDEAHNLPGRAADWFSPSLDAAWIDGLRKAPLHPPDRGLRRSLNAQIRKALAILGDLEGPHRRLELDPAPFLAQEHRLGTLLASRNGVELPSDHPLVALFRAWSSFCDVLRILDEPHIPTWIPPGRLQITCADASAHLHSRMASAANAILFSATLKPFEFHRRLSGLEGLPVLEREILSPFPPGNRKVLIVPQISTLLKRRDREVERVARFLERVLPLRTGNYLVFFPSFDMLDKTAAHLDLPGFRILPQPRRASAPCIEAILADLRRERNLVVLAVQGGSLSEGIDLPGENLIGAVVVGPPLPPFDLEREEIRRYFDRKYGCGRRYAYSCLAAAKAVQAAGRVIRTPRDRGLLVFLDSRFLEKDFTDGFPADWYERSPLERVSTSILADVEAFWGDAPTSSPACSP